MSTLVTAFEKAMQRTPMIEFDPHRIPPITDPMGRYWRQPDLSKVLIDDTHAIIDKTTFEQLAEYSGTVPTGCYPGKAWRRHNGIYDHEWQAKGGKPYWQLCWYGYSRDGNPKFCSNNFRTVLFA